MTDNQLIADLKATKQALATRGRCRMVLENMDGKVCLDGAILMGCGIKELPHAYKAFECGRPRAVVNALFKALGDDWKSDILCIPYAAVYYFNDDPDTTDQDCFDLIDKALAQHGGLA